MTERRYDKEEDRYNDIKTHDNPNHESYKAYQNRLMDTDAQMETWQEEGEIDDRKNDSKR